MIPYAKHDICEEDIENVLEVLKSSSITQGSIVPKFEHAVTHYTDARYGVAVNSGTAALHIACQALGLGPGDLLWTTPNSFVASANCGLYCGASVDFVDIELESGLMSSIALEEKLIKAKKIGIQPKIVIPVHFAGQSCDMQAIQILGQQYGFRIIEDACHALGGLFDGNPVGSCEYSDIATFSFHPAKAITTSEGGMAVTNDDDLYRKMLLLRTHGITRDLSHLPRECDKPWYYQQLALGFNYRLSDLAAALGLSQIGRLDQYLTRRREISNLYDELTQDLPLRTLVLKPNVVSGLHLFVVRVLEHGNGVRRDIVLSNLRRWGIGASLHYIPIHTQPFYKGLGFEKEDFPNSVKFSQQVMSLPMYPTLENEEVIYIVEKVKQALG